MTEIVVTPMDKILHAVESARKVLFDEKSNIDKVCSDDEVEKIALVREQLGDLIYHWKAEKDRWT